MERIVYVLESQNPFKSLFFVQVKDIVSLLTKVYYMGVGFLVTFETVCEGKLVFFY